MKRKSRDENVNKYVEVKRYKLNIKWILALFIIILTLTSFYIGYVKKLVYKNVYSNISELSEQTATQLNLSITDQKNFVQIMVDSINRGYFKTHEQIFDRFKGDLANYHFTRLVILDKNGNGTTSDGHIVNDYPNIEEFFNNHDSVYLSENRPSTVSNNQVNIYSRTFTLNGQEFVLMATINTSDYKEILLRRLFGKGGTYLINNDGYILIDSFEIIPDNETNLYHYLKENFNISKSSDIAKIDNMADSIKRHEVGTFDVSFERETVFIHFEKVNVNDWYVVTVATDSTIAKDLITLVITTLLLCLAVNFIITGISIYIDITNQRQNRKLYKVAYIDPVTLLGNEAYFRDNGSLYLQNQTENSYIITADINKFKALNNIYGYEFCNNILKAIGDRLLKLLPSDNITCRVSNDVFASIFSYDSNIENLLNNLINDTSMIKIDNIEVPINLSIGVYKIKDDDKDINKILDKSYMARSEIKGLYNTNYYIFDDVLENQLVEEQRLESCMENALKNNEFVIVYQPKVYTNTEKLAGAEALVRWCKDGEMISPAKFIPLFEKNKFITKLDSYIFEQVCKDMAMWKDKYNFVPTVSINVSKEHFVNVNLAEEYAAIADKYNVDRGKIDLEITESATIDSNIDILKIMYDIKEKGFTISIDDFGTGYSSLSMLQNMPIDIIKIDKVFVDKANLNSDRNIINYIMYIAEHLNAKTIVEGVETLEQVEFVRKIKCDIIQGYFYSKPVSRDEFEGFFDK